MVHLPTLNAMRDYWEENRPRLLRKYSGGFIVITPDMAPKAEHYKTHAELKKAYPDIDELVFGTKPLVFEVYDEIKNSPKNPSREQRSHLKKLLEAPR